MNASLRMLDAHTLLVSGMSVSCHPYQIQITDPRRAQLWAEYLRPRKFSCHSMGPQRKEARKKLGLGRFGVQFRRT
jgi:hypothetical protein